MEKDIFILWLLAIHFVSDFLMQSRRMGRNKGKSNKWLLYHVIAYTVSMMFGILLITGNIEFSIIYGIVNGMIHFPTDWITSRISGLFYKKLMDDPKNMAWEYLFWATIGFDQLLHAAALILTLKVL